MELESGQRNGLRREVVMECSERLRSNAGDDKESQFSQIIGNSPSLESVILEVERVAPTDSTVLILGETGTGRS